ncbi:LAFE_0G01486g1_1 [Lachancea fermentati]|uniref:LAFE_0G01486g1_1 n=1 Tax=Lachancea fermentati TaxID=4955 RepID=A0A1G4MGV3_LACFM|nr:LAFE_0G01486g1_1 [Lachancea fermentati]
MLLDTSSSLSTTRKEDIGTILEDIYVDVYFSADQTLPYMYSTVSVATISVFNKNGNPSTTTDLTSQVTTTSSTKTDNMHVSTEIVVQLLATSHSSISRISTLSGTSNPITSSSTELSRSSSTSEIVDKLSTTGGASNDIVGVSIGLPIGVFCFGLILILVFLWYRNHRKSYSFSEKQQINNNETHKKCYQSWFSGRKANPPKRRKHDAELGIVGDNYDTDNMLDYKITRIDHNPYKTHVETPQKTLGPPNRSLSSQQINTLLYTQPPGIQHIQSELPSSSSAQFNVSSGQNDPENFSRARNWNYESPLSRWFLTKSTYLQDQVMPSLKTPTVKLKHLRILSRVGKHNVQSILVDEKSPILEKKASPLSASPPQEGSSRLDPLVFRSSSLKCNKPDFNGKSQETDNTQRDSHLFTTAEFAKYNPYSKKLVLSTVIKPQTIDDPKLDISTRMIKSVPKNTRIKDGHQRFDIKEKPLEKYLTKIGTDKPLPKTPKSALVSEDPNIIKNIIGAKFQSKSLAKNENNEDTEDNNATEKLSDISVVVREYTPRLVDEIHITHGEYVRVLARHTDGWCLIEKCKRDGTLIKKNDVQHDHIDGKHYLNDYRGIVPGVCLRAL